MKKNENGKLLRMEIKRNLKDRKKVVKETKADAEGLCFFSLYPNLFSFKYNGNINFILIQNNVYSFIQIYIKPKIFIL